MDSSMRRALPDSAPTPTEALPPTCRVPGCTGSWHDDDICDVVFADLAGPGSALIVEVSVEPGETAEAIVWEGTEGRNLLRTRDQAEAVAFADKLRALAAAVDTGAALLAGPSARPAKPDPAVDFASRFAALDSDVLFDLEAAGDCDNASRYVESLLIVLAEWRPRVVAMLADAPEWAVPEAAAYRRALDRTREAWVQWNFRWEGGPALPDTFDLPEPAPKGTQITGTPVARIVSAGRRDQVVREVAA
jgi:hypothetical protein